MTLHAISNIDNPNLVWFCRRQKIVLRINETEGVVSYVPLWVQTREVDGFGFVIEHTNPDPGIILN